MGSWTGLFCTAVVFVVMTSYSLVELQRLVKGRNPLIANSEVTGRYQTAEEGLDYHEFKVAFYVEDYVTSEPKDDPSMVSIYGMIFELDESNILSN